MLASSGLTRSRAPLRSYTQLTGDTVLRTNFASGTMGKGLVLSVSGWEGNRISVAREILMRVVVSILQCRVP